MAKITFLGTASAVPDAHHQNSHFILETEKRLLLVDCVGNPVVRLEEAGVDPLSVKDLILTHFHPDHVSGVPLLLMDMWLMGRQAPLDIYCLEMVMARFSAMMALYDWQDWTGFYPIHMHSLPSFEMVSLIDTDGLKVWGSTVCHMIPAMGLRMIIDHSTIAYSTDTAPCDAVVRLAAQADILIHEASGAANGHSSAAQAGEVATRAGARKLVLTHYPPEEDPVDLLAQAQSSFSGEVVIATDMMTLKIR